MKMKDTVTVQGMLLTRDQFRKALQAVFDAIPRGKRAPLMREMSVVEATGTELFVDHSDEAQPEKK